MKRFVLCILLVLLTLIFSIAAAENHNCCACCSANECTVTSDTPADSARTARPSKFDLEGFTTEVDQLDFKFFLPSSFEALSYSPERYRSTYSSRYPYVRIEPEPLVAYLPVHVFYTDREQLRSSLDLYALYHSEYEVIQMDECLGLLHFFQSDDFSQVSINVTNRREICNVFVVSDSLDDALELAHAIIDHAVAKEIPLDELEQAE